MASLTKPQRQALEWLQERGGNGVVNRYGKVMASGEIAGFDAATWLRLICAGLIVSEGPARLRLAASEACDCECPTPSSGAALVSEECPVHNLHPSQPDLPRSHVAELAKRLRFAGTSGSPGRDPEKYLAQVTCHDAIDAAAALLSQAAVIGSLQDALATALRIDGVAKRSRSDGRVFVDARDWEPFIPQVRAALALITASE